MSQFQKSTLYKELEESLSKNESKSLPPVSVPKPAPYLVQLRSLCWRNLKNIKRGKKSNNIFSYMTRPTCV